MLHGKISYSSQPPSCRSWDMTNTKESRKNALRLAPTFCLFVHINFFLSPSLYSLCHSNFLPFFQNQQNNEIHVSMTHGSAQGLSESVSFVDYHMVCIFKILISTYHSMFQLKTPFRVGGKVRDN